MKLETSPSTPNGSVVRFRRRYNMTQFTIHQSATAPEGSRDILNNVQQAWGFVPNLHNVLAESPQALEAYAATWALFDKTAFSPVERNIVYLAIIFENECSYCMAGHSGLSKMAGVKDAHIAAVRNGTPIDDAKLEALRQFAQKVTRQRGRLSDADTATFLAAGYDNRAILDVILAAAVKLISNYTNHFANTPLDAFMAGNEWTPPSALARAA
jgi:uncharacterized peroxidase-related enzyme